MHVVSVIGLEKLSFEKKMRACQHNEQPRTHIKTYIFRNNSANNWVWILMTSTHVFSNIEKKNNFAAGWFSTDVPD